MTILIRKHLFLRAFCALLMTVSLNAFAEVGRILFAVGPVSIEREDVFKVKKGALIEEGDVIITGKKARVQLLMADGARVAVRANSRFQIEAYRLPATAPSTVATNLDEGEATMRLLKGGMRTITGAIGKGNNKDVYQMHTPVATLGIRGTQYEVTINSATLAAVIGVTTGAIVTITDEGTTNYAAGEFVAITPSGDEIPLTQAQYNEAIAEADKTN
ncbi:FecR domain-containing protein, partial [Halieaceae bacterium]|nr:FecR domain-containing protein [Halieaceae bacterium]